MRDPLWLPQEGELHYEWFRRYRDMTTPRSYAKCALAVEKSPMEIRAIADEWQWERRALAYERYLEAEYQKARDMAMDQVVAEHKAAAMEWHKFAMNQLRKLQVEADRMDIAMVGPEKLSKLWETAIKMTRLAMGEATDHKKIETSAMNFSLLTDEELLLWEELQGKASSKG